MKNYPDELNEEIAIERWENEGGEVKPLPERRTNYKKILICVACLIILPFVYRLLKRIER